MSEVNSTYYSHARSEAVALLPAVDSCLEVGAGAGGTLRLIRERNPNAWLGAVELDPEHGGQIDADKVVIGDLETVDLSQFQKRSVDAIVCLDILEHLRDPWVTVQKLSSMLSPGGVMLTSVPNVQHLSVIGALLRGRWNYVSEGVLDATHLRFFVRSSFFSLLRKAGLSPVDMEITCSTPLGLLNALTGRVAEGFIAYQYIVLSVKGPGTLRQPSYWRHLSDCTGRFSEKVRSRLQ